MKLTLKEFIQKEVGASYDMDTIFFNLESDQVLEIIESYTKYVKGNSYKRQVYGYCVEVRTYYENSGRYFWTNLTNKVYDNKFIAEQAMENLKRDYGIFRDREWRIVCLHYFENK